MPADGRRLRVAVVNHDASRTGAPTVGGELVKALRSENWDTVLVFRWWGDGPGELGTLADRAVREPATLLRIGMQRLDALRPAAHVVARRAIRSLLGRLKPDLVWCNSVMTAEYAMVATAMGIPAVLHSHERSEDVDAALNNSGFMAAGVAESPLLTLVACATGTADVLAKELGVPRERVQVLHSAVDLDAVVASAASAPRPYSAKPVVVACGTANVTKGVDVFNEAATSARAAGDPATWVWVGAAPPEHRVDAVSYVGEQLSAAPWLAGADVVVVPSRFEQLSLVVLEAMALGTPVVASDLPGPRELLGDTGVLVPPADAAALREAVVKLLADPNRSARLASRAEARCRDMWNLPRFQVHARAIAEEAARPSPSGLAPPVGRTP